MTDLTSLIEKAEKAASPDRELDGHIHNTVFGTAYVFAPHSVTGFLTSAINNGCPTVAGYTSSIDAAISLAERVLPNWQINLSIFHDALSEASFGNREAPHVRSMATKPALAICLATLRALQQKGSSNG